jgi:hypothetical protein
LDRNFYFILKNSEELQALESKLFIQLKYYIFEYMGIELKRIFLYKVYDFNTQIIVLQNKIKPFNRNGHFSFELFLIICELVIN